MTRRELESAARQLGLCICGPCSTCAQLHEIRGLEHLHCRELSRVITDPEKFGCRRHRSASKPP